MKIFKRSVHHKPLSECTFVSAFLEYLIISLSAVSCSQCWNRICCCWASNCNVLWEVKYACEHSDWEMGIRPNRHKELLRYKRRGSSVLSGGKCCQKVKPLFFWVKFEPVYLRNRYAAILLFWLDQIAYDWSTGPLLLSVYEWLRLSKAWPVAVSVPFRSFRRVYCASLAGPVEVHAACFSWLPSCGKMWSKTCRVYACASHLLTESHSCCKWYSQVWFSWYFVSKLDLGKDMRCFNFSVTSIYIKPVFEVLFYGFVNRHFHRFAS